MIHTRRYGDTDGNRFWSYVRLSERCWEWTGYKNAKGYGVINLKGLRVLTHRMAYELEVGPIPEGMSVLHHCDNPACVRPKHLFLGTRADNNADMTAKRRQRTAPMPGEANHRAKLTEAAVRAIRASDASGPTLAAQYDVTRTTICAIRLRKIWSHVE